MNSDDKKKFIEDFTKSCIEEIKEKVDDMPDNWDGFELRWYIADFFKRECMGDQDNRTKRRRKYKNDVLVNNL